VTYLLPRRGRSGWASTTWLWCAVSRRVRLDTTERLAACDADTVVAVIESLNLDRGAPKHLRMDNGPEMIAWALRDWCRLAGTGTVYIEPGSPWQNPWVELTRR